MTITVDRKNRDNDPGETLKNTSRGLHTVYQLYKKGLPYILLSKTRPLMQIS